MNLRNWKTFGHYTTFRLQRDYQEVMTYRSHENFVGCVLYLEPSEHFPDGLVVTGGYDKVIFVYKPGEPFPTYTFKGEHTNTGRPKKNSVIFSWRNFL